MTTVVVEKLSFFDQHFPTQQTSPFLIYTAHKILERLVLRNCLQFQQVWSRIIPEIKK